MIRVAIALAAALSLSGCTTAIVRAKCGPDGANDWTRSWAGTPQEITCEQVATPTKAQFLSMSNAQSGASSRRAAVQYALDAALDTEAAAALQRLAGENERLRVALTEISIFAGVRGEDDRRTFARVQRQALQFIANKAKDAAISDPSHTGGK